MESSTMAPKSIERLKKIELWEKAKHKQQFAKKVKLVKYSLVCIFFFMVTFVILNRLDLI